MRQFVCTNCPNGECGQGETECNCPQDCEKEENISNWQTFRDEEHRYEIKFPANFKREKTSTSEYWFGKLSKHIQGGQFLTFKYIPQNKLTYCREHLEDVRCENFKWDNLEAVIDWNFKEINKYNIEQSSSTTEIQHPDGGVVIISIDPPPANTEIKSKFQQIISTFKFTETGLNKELENNNNNKLNIKKDLIYHILAFLILVLVVFFLWRKMRKI